MFGTETILGNIFPLCFRLAPFILAVFFSLKIGQNLFSTVTKISVCRLLVVKLNQTIYFQ